MTEVELNIFKKAMKEAMLPIPLTKIKQEPTDEGEGTREKNNTPMTRTRSTPPSGENGINVESSDALSFDRYNCDRSENLSNGSDSGDVIINEAGSDVGNKNDFKYECPICQARFKSARAFRGHGIVHRFGSVPELRSRLPPMDVGTCSMQCSPKRLGFESSSFKCDGCQTVFNSRDSYAMHMLMRAKDENCSGLVTDSKHHLLEEGFERGTLMDSQLDTSNALRQGLWNLQMLQKGRHDGKMFDYQQIIPDLIQSPSGTRDLIVCRICGEIFQSKDSLAMHMMFHTQSEAENSRRGWTVIYASAMADLSENPEDLIANHELVPIDDPAQESLDGVPRPPNEGDVPYNEGVSDDPCYSDEGNEGLDLSMTSKMNGSKESSTGSNEKITRSWFGDHGNKSMEISSSALGSKRPEVVTDLKTLPSDVQDQLFCFQYDPPKSPPKIPRSQSADVNMNRNTENEDPKQDINIIKCLTENPARITPVEKVNRPHYENRIRPKSADGVLHRLDRHVSPSLIGRIRKLRKSRVPIKKHPFRHPFRSEKPPEHPKQEPQRLKEQRQPVTENTRGISDLLATRGKDLSYCKYCEIIYLDRTLFQLHMGLHNVNNPWQCNACGRICANRLEFSSHVLHY